jgi:TPR repeat protein
MLARYLAEGVAGEPSPSEAIDWLQRAADQGVEAAQQELFLLNARQTQAAP